MHIVHCLTHSIDGGGQEIPYLLVKSLKKYFPDIKHTIILPANGVYVQRFKELNIPVINFPFNHISIFSFVSILKLLKQLNPDVIHSHGRGAGIYSRLLPRIFLARKVIHTHHGFHVPENHLLKIVFTFLEKILIPGTSITIAVSESEKNEIRKLLSLPEEQIVCIPNVIDHDEVIQRAGESNEDLLKNIINQQYPFRVVMIARDDPIKNYSLACAAANSVLLKDTTSSFYFVGAKDSSLLSKLISDYPNRVFQIPLLKNPLPLLKQASILLITSKREGGPLVVLESFALGKPVVGTNVRGINDYVQHGKNGLLADENKSQLAEAILKLINNANLLNILSNCAKESFRAGNLENWCKKYYNLYNSIR